MYVMLVDLPETYKIARHEISNTRECVLCADETPENDLGFTFGKCGHYVCQGCCEEYRESLKKVTKCFYCRRETNVKLDEPESAEETESKKSKPDDVIDLTRQAEMMILKRLRLI